MYLFSAIMLNMRQNEHFPISLSKTENVYACIDEST